MSAYTGLLRRENWMDARASDRNNSPMPPAFRVERLSDEFGQYTLVLTCRDCRHERKADPHALGRICGWDARLDDLAKRLRCSKCGKKACTIRAVPPYKPRGYSSLPK